MPYLPQVSGEKLSGLLKSLGYEFLRQRGSHARYKLTKPIGTSYITVPMHHAIAKGTLNDILSEVSLWTGISKDNLINRL